MAFDSSPPRTGLIFLFGVISVLTLTALKFVFDSYFDKAVLGEQARKAALYPTKSLYAVRKEQDRLLHEGPLPIDRAVWLVGERGRRVSKMIEPQPSEDTGALLGWKQSPTGWKSRSVAAATDDVGKTP